MADDSDLERSFPATPRRIEQARAHGQVARSRELATAVVALAATVALSAVGGQLVQQCAKLVHDTLAFDRDVAFRDAAMGELLQRMSVEILVALGPFLLVVLAASLLGPVLLSGWNMSVEALAPDFGRLNPLKGLASLFSRRAAGELVKALLKSGLIAAAGTLAIVQLWSHLEGLAGLEPSAGIVEVGHEVLRAVFVLIGGLVVIAAIDVPYQLWTYYAGLRMTREELRQEMKEEEGDPHLKARIRSLQRDAARKRMMAAVPKASVIVTNPTHYAVALHYEEGMRAPRVVAKGMDLVAEKIKEIGRTHRVPVLEAPPLARALHRHGELDQEIPQALYGVVAQVLAYVYQVQRWQASGGKAPVAPAEFAVPPELDLQTRRRTFAADAREARDAR